MASLKYVTLVALFLFSNAAFVLAEDKSPSPFMETWYKLKTHCGFDRGGKNRDKYVQQIKTVMEFAPLAPDIALREAVRRKDSASLKLSGNLNHAIISNDIDALQRLYAQNGLVKAAGALSQLYLYGTNTKKNLAEALELAQFGAKYGDISSLNALALYYRFEKHDYEESSFWICYSALPNLPNIVPEKYMHYSLALLGQEIYFGSGTIAQDKALAVEVFLMVIDMKLAALLQGENLFDEVMADAHYFVMQAYSLGEGVSQDWEKARMHARQAFFYGEEQGLRWLAAMYAGGRGVKKSIEKAFSIALLGQKTGINFSEKDIKSLKQGITEKAINSIEKHVNACLKKHVSKPGWQISCAEDF